MKSYTELLEANKEWAAQQLSVDPKFFQILLKRKLPNSYGLDVVTAGCPQMKLRVQPW